VEGLFRLSAAARRDPAVEAWFGAGDPLRLLVRPWFEALRDCGEDVFELMHDRRPTVCVEGAALAYVDAFSAHGAIGFFHGAELEDPLHLLRGSGRRMRHVRLSFGEEVDAAALERLIAEAYRKLHARLADEG